MSVPRLLVSVRNLSEARAAVEGGCDLLDVKEPARGPLGMADLDVIAEIATFAASTATAGDTILASAALGEIEEWLHSSPSTRLPAEVAYAKLGPANLETRSRWLDGWRRTRESFDSLNPSRVRWIAVAYADWHSARSLAPHCILEAAIEARCDGFLLDTHRKDGGSSIDVLGRREITRLATEAHQAELIFALAGSLRAAHLPALVGIRPHVIAVRGAACEDQCRSAAVSSESVRRLKSELVALFSEAPQRRISGSARASPSRSSKL
jgi:(5-formylfuran-3-yl)methyl phosphate synthase